MKSDSAEVCAAAAKTRTAGAQPKSPSRTNVMDTETAADTSRGSNARVINRRKINGVLTMTSTINKIGRERDEESS